MLSKESLKTWMPFILLCILVGLLYLDYFILRFSWMPDQFGYHKALQITAAIVIGVLAIVVVNLYASQFGAALAAFAAVPIGYLMVYSLTEQISTASSTTALQNAKLGLLSSAIAFSAVIVFDLLSRVKGLPAWLKSPAAQQDAIAEGKL